MDAFRDLIHSLGLQPQHFNYLIALDILIGSIWAVKRLYDDFTQPPPTEDEPG
jgi:hypothetical protein